MKKYIFFLCMFSTALVFTSCTKDEDNMGIDWELLKVGAVNRNEKLVEKELSKLFSDYQPLPKEYDYLGHAENIEIIIERINKSGQMTAALLDYATENELSFTEIIIIADYYGTPIYRVIRIETSDSCVLKFHSIHRLVY